MTKYMDTEIIPRRILAKKNRALSIDKTVKIGGESYSFKRVKVREDGVSIIIPEQFAKMSEAAAKEKYATDYRPQRIFTNHNGTVNIAFSLSEDSLEKSQIKEMATEFKTAIKSKNPANVFITQKTEILGNTKIGYFDFKGYGVDQNLYSLIFITSIKGNMLFGVFNCAFDIYRDWKRLAVQMILSIREIADDDVDEDVGKELSDNGKTDSPRNRNKRNYSFSGDFA